MCNKNKLLAKEYIETEANRKAALEAVGTMKTTETESVPSSMLPRSELVSARTEFTRTFENADHSHTVEIFMEPVHYKDGSGRWQEMDDSLEETMDAVPGNMEVAPGTMLPMGQGGEAGVSRKECTARFMNRKGDWEASLYKDAGSGKLASVTSGGSAIRWSLEGASSVQAVVSGKDRLLYEGIFPETALNSRIRGKTVKEDIILRSPAAPHVFTYCYEAGDLVPVQDGNGISFREKADDRDTEIFHVAAPSMADASGAILEDVPMVLGQVQGGSCLIKLQPDEAWLSDEARVYPVTIDPATTTSKSADEIFDAHTDAENPGSNYQQSNILKTRGGVKPQRTLIRFTLPDIQAGDMVINARLVMTPLLSGNASRTISVHKILQDWGSGMVTWYNEPVFEDDAQDIKTFQGNTQGAQYITLDVTAMVKEWYRDGSNHGLLVKDLTELGGYTEYLSSDNVVDWQDYRPYIAISYVNYSGLEDFWSYHTQDAGRAGETHVNDYNGNLIFVHPVLDTDGSRMPMDLSLTWNSNDKDTNIGYGKGFRLSCHQKVEQKTIAGTVYYKHVEGDGTVHYFYYDTSDSSNNRWADEMTKDLTLTVNTSSADRYVITDKEGNRQVFNAAGYLVREEDANGNALVITYNSQNKVSQVVDGAGRTAVVTYQNGDSGNIRSVSLCAAGSTTALKTKSFTYSGSTIIQSNEFDGTHCYFTYNSDSLLTSIRSQDGQKLMYGYSTNAPYRVVKVTEYGDSGTGSWTEGESLDLEYGYNSTRFTDRKGRSEILRFDNSGRLLHVQDGFGHAASASYYDTGAKKLKNTTRLQATAVQLLSDPAIMLAESSSPWVKSVSGSGSASIASGNSVIGNNALKVAASDTGSEAHWKQDVTLEKGKTYTFSMYVKAAVTSAASNGFVRIHVTYKDASGTSKYASSRQVKAGTVGFERFSATFTLPADASSATVTCWIDLYHVNGTAWGDMAQLETGKTCSRVNLADNGSFQNGDISGFTKTGTAADMLVTASSGTPKPGYHGLITIRQATLRQEPGTSAAAVTTLAGGTRLYGSYSTGGSSPWYRVETSSGQKGWIQAADVMTAYAGSDAEMNGNGFPVPGNSYFVLYSAANPSASKVLEAGPAGVRLVIHGSTTGTDGKAWYHATVMLVGTRYTGYAPTEAVMRLVRTDMAAVTTGAAVMYSLPSTSSSSMGTKASGTQVPVRGIVSTSAGNFFGILSGSTYVFLREADLDITAEDVGSLAAPVSEVVVPAAIDGLDSHVFRFIGDRTADKKLTKTLTISGEANDAFLVNAWGKGRSLPQGTETGRHFGVEVTFVYTDNSTKVCYAEFSPDLLDWQFLSEVFLPEKAYKQVKVAYVFCHQEGYAFVDGLALYREEYGETYTYDGKGNVISSVDAAKQSSSFSYNANQDLTGITDPRGNSFTYEYDNKHNVKKGVSAVGIRTDLLYDSYGNILQSGTVDPTVVVTGSDGNTDPDQTTGMWVKRTFTSDGNHAATIKDAAGNTATYAWDTARDRLTSVTDPKGTVTSYTYDAMDRVTKVSTAIEGCQAAENTYTYTKDKLASIGHNGFQYGFTYDIYGNTSAVSIAGTNVVAYQYEPNNGNLLQTTYANGDVLRCIYDGQDRVTGIFQTQSGGTEQKLFTYTYDREGYLAVVKDETLARTTRLYYDLLGRLCQAEVSDGTGFRYTYDANNNMTSLKYYAEATFATDYTYDKDNRERTAKAFGHTRTTHYDKLGRVTEKNWDETTSGGTTTAVHKTLYRYFDTDAHKRWNQVRQISVGGKTTSYTYDANGNISTITDSSGTRSYFYDKRNQLVRENDPIQDKTILYTYDLGGNLASQTEYAYTTAATVTGTPVKVITATFRTSGWKDQLLSWDGQAMTYDAAGNMLTKGSTTYIWAKGRKLASATKGGTTTTYAYDHTGARIRKTVGSTVTDFRMAGSLLMSQKAGSTVTYFAYDCAGQLIGMSAGSNRYYYVRNAQNDITGLIDASGTLVVEYKYDAWGKLLSTTGSLASTIGVRNPFRYRGYYYDTETGLYYVGSRYYDPEIRRFISADTIDVVTKKKMIEEKNLFSYCDNNPIVREDENGQGFILSCIAIAAVGGIIGAAISTVGSIVSQVIESKEVNWKTVGVEAAGGFVGGAIAASPIGLPGQIIAGGIVGGTTYAADCAVNHRRIEPLDLGIAVTTGCISGWIGGSGANKDYELSKAIRRKQRIESRCLRNAGDSFYKKRLTYETKYLTGKLTQTGIKSSIRYSVGMTSAKAASPLFRRGILKVSVRSPRYACC